MYARHPNQMPKSLQLALLDTEGRQLYSEPLQDVRAPLHIFKGECGYHLTETLFSLL